MIAAIGAGAADVLWSVGLLARYSWAILPLAAVPAAQRIFAAMHPDHPAVYAWPLETLVGVLRLATLAAVLWLGWRADAADRRPGLDSAGEVLSALGAYLRHDAGRVVAAVLVATAILAALNVLGGPMLEALVRSFSDDPRVAEAWVFGVRNLLTIPLFYAVAYGIVRPAFLISTA